MSGGRMKNLTIFCHSGGYTCHYSHPNAGESNTYGSAQTCLLVATSTTIKVAPCIVTADGAASQTFSAVLPYTTIISTGSTISTSTADSLEALAPLYVTPEDTPASTPLLSKRMSHSCLHGRISHHIFTEYKSTGGWRTSPLQLQRQLAAAQHHPQQIQTREIASPAVPSPGLSLGVLLGFLQ